MRAPKGQTNSPKRTRLPFANIYTIQTIPQSQINSVFLAFQPTPQKGGRRHPGASPFYTNFNRVCIILYNSIVPVARKAEACKHRSLLLDTKKLGCALSAIDNCQLAPIWFGLALCDLWHWRKIEHIATWAVVKMSVPGSGTVSCSCGGLCVFRSKDL